VVADSTAQHMCVILSVSARGSEAAGRTQHPSLARLIRTRVTAGQLPSCTGGERSTPRGICSSGSARCVEPRRPQAEDGTSGSKQCTLARPQTTGEEGQGLAMRRVYAALGEPMLYGGRVLWLSLFRLKQQRLISSARMRSMRGACGTATVLTMHVITSQSARWSAAWLTRQSVPNDIIL
jgi:hypothetical protein